MNKKVSNKLKKRNSNKSMRTNSNNFEKTNSNKFRQATSNNFDKPNSDKSKKIISKKFRNITIVAVVILVLVAAPFIFNSRKSDYQKALEAGETTAAGESASGTTISTDTNTTVQETNSEKEPAAATSGSETASATETTAQPVDPAAQQIIEVIASGGYSPREIDAKADVPTILIMKSEGAYGCERAFNIPDLGISEILPENGQTQFDLGTHAKGTTLAGVCGMGMYYFQIFFN